MAGNRVTSILEIITKGAGQAVQSFRQIAGSADSATSSTNTLTTSNDNYHRGAKAVYQTNLASARQFSKLTQTIGASGSSGLVAAYATLAANLYAATAAFTTLSNAAQLQQMQQSLTVIGELSGRNLDVLVNKLKEVTDNAISTEEALRAVSFGVSAGFDDTQLSNLAKVAKGASLALGRDMSDAMDRLTRGAAKLEPEILDELGIIVRLETATATYAAQIGKAVDQLTQYERTQAFINAINEQGAAKFGLVADAVDANPWNKLLAALKEVQVFTLNLINNFLKFTGIINFLSENLVALGGVLLLFASTISKAVLPSMYNMPRAAKAAAAQMANLSKQSLDALVTTGKLPKAFKTLVDAEQAGTATTAQRTRGLRALQETIDTNTQRIESHNKALADGNITQAKHSYLVGQAQDKINQATQAQQRYAAVTRDAARASVYNAQAQALQLASSGNVIQGVKSLSLAWSENNKRLREASAGVGILRGSLNAVQGAAFIAVSGVRFFGTALLAALPWLGIIITLIPLLIEGFKKLFPDSGVEKFKKSVKEIRESTVKELSTITNSLVTFNNNFGSALVPDVERIKVAYSIIAGIATTAADNASNTLNKILEAQGTELASIRQQIITEQQALAKKEALGYTGLLNQPFKDNIAALEKQAQELKDNLTPTIKEQLVSNANLILSQIDVASELGLSTNKVNEYTNSLNNLKTSYDSGEISLSEYLEGQEKLKVGLNSLDQSVKGFPRALEELGKAQNAVFQKQQTPISNIVSVYRDLQNRVKDLFESTEEGEAIKTFNSWANQLYSFTGQLFRTREEFDNFINQVKANDTLFSFYAFQVESIKETMGVINNITSEFPGLLRVSLTLQQEQSDTLLSQLELQRLLVKTTDQRVEIDRQIIAQVATRISNREIEYRLELQQLDILKQQNAVEQTRNEASLQRFKTEKNIQAALGVISTGRAELETAYKEAELRQKALRAQEALDLKKIELETRIADIQLQAQASSAQALNQYYQKLLQVRSLEEATLSVVNEGLLRTTQAIENAITFRQKQNEGTQLFQEANIDPQALVEKLEQLLPALRVDVSYIQDSSATTQLLASADSTAEALSSVISKSKEELERPVTTKITPEVDRETLAKDVSLATRQAIESATTSPLNLTIDIDNLQEIRRNIDSLNSIVQVILQVSEVEKEKLLTRVKGILENGMGLELEVPVSLVENKTATNTLIQAGRIAAELIATQFRQSIDLINQPISPQISPTVTSSTLTNAVNDAANAGFDQVTSKPLSLQLVLENLEQVKQELTTLNTVLFIGLSIKEEEKDSLLSTVQSLFDKVPSLSLTLNKEELQNYTPDITVKIPVTLNNAEDTITRQLQELKLSYAVRVPMTVSNAYAALAEVRKVFLEKPLSAEIEIPTALLQSKLDLMRLNISLLPTISQLQLRELLPTIRASVSIVNTPELVREFSKIEFSPEVVLELARVGEQIQSYIDKEEKIKFVPMFEFAPLKTVLTQIEQDTIDLVIQIQNYAEIVSRLNAITEMKLQPEVEIITPMNLDVSIKNVEVFLAIKNYEELKEKLNNELFQNRTIEVTTNIVTPQTVPAPTVAPITVATNAVIDERQVDTTRRLTAEAFTGAIQDIGPAGITISPSLNTNEIQNQIESLPTLFGRSFNFGNMTDDAFRQFRNNLEGAREVLSGVARSIQDNVASMPKEAIVQGAQASAQTLSNVIDAQDILKDSAKQSTEAVRASTDAQEDLIRANLEASIAGSGISNLLTESLQNLAKAAEFDDQARFDQIQIERDFQQDTISYLVKRSKEEKLSASEQEALQIRISAERASQVTLSEQLLQVNLTNLSIFARELELEKQRRAVSLQTIENDMKASRFLQGATDLSTSQKLELIELERKNTIENIKIQKFLDMSKIATEAEIQKIKLRGIQEEYKLLSTQAKEAGKLDQANALSKLASNVGTIIGSIDRTTSAQIQTVIENAKVSTEAANEAARSQRLGVVGGVQNTSSPISEIGTGLETSIRIGSIDTNSIFDAFEAAQDTFESATEEFYKRAGEKNEAAKDLFKFGATITKNVETTRAALAPFINDLRNLGPDGQLIAGVTAGGLTIVDSLGSMTESFALFSAESEFSTEKLKAGAAVLQGLGAAIAGIGQIQQAASGQRIAELDREIEAEKKRDGKSKESQARIAALERKKEQEKKKAFEMNKKMMMAQTVINTAAGIMAAVAKDGPLGIAMAILIGAMGAAQLAIIAGTSYQGASASAGASVPSKIEVGERSNKVDVAQRPTGGELAYIQGARGMGTTANDFRPAFMGAQYRATGGYIVGEQGPELFVPETPGKIVPNDEMGQMGQPINVSFNISAIDAVSFNDMLTDQRGNIISMIRQAANSHGQPFLETVDTLSLAPAQRTYYRKA